MEKLIGQMKVVLADTFALYLKAHNFHWNIEGPNFPQYHKFLNDLYDELFEAVDSVAEHIRTLNAYVPGSFTRFKELSSIEDELNVPEAMSMIKKLLEDNKKVISSLEKAHELGVAEKAHGIVNFIEERIDVHFKHDWMLRSIVKV
jgi:starvation-inducible DNA-binding protein